MSEPHLSDTIDAQAIAWLVRVNDPAFADWEPFSTWLAQSPAHAAAYHAVAAAEADVRAVLMRAPEAAPSAAGWMPAPRLRARWRPWLATAVAAALVAVIGVRVADRAPEDRIYETAPGASRTIALADGSSVTLNGASRLVADTADPRRLRLERGQGLFRVRHDAAHPFTVAVGGALVTDVGTAFDIVREARTTRIAVAEGAVDFSRGGNAVRLDAGKALRADDGAATVAVVAVSPDAVGGWSRGQLAFDGASLESAAADLARTLGVAIRVEPAIAARPVRGVIRLDGGPDAVLPRLASLLGVRAERDGAGWRLLASS